MAATQALRAEANTLSVETAIASFKARKAKVGIIGLGYVGIPLALAAAKTGFSVLGFDIDEARIQQLNRGESNIRHIPSTEIAGAVKDRRFEATANFARLGEPDAILICVPTPLTRQREPDLSFVVNTARSIAPHLRKGQLIVLEVHDVSRNHRRGAQADPRSDRLTERHGFLSGVLAGTRGSRQSRFGTATIPKVVGGDGPDALRSPMRSISSSSCGRCRCRPRRPPRR